MGKTTIEWVATHLDDGTLAPGYTFNPWHGCQKVSLGCQHCYAEGMARRFSNRQIWGPASTTARKLMSDSYWRGPVTWNAGAEREGIRYKVFCGSMCDVFEDHPSVHETRMLWLWPLVERTPHLDWLLLTKRPENVMDFVPALWKHGGWPANVWIGASVENQEWAEKRIPALVEIPAPVTFVSYEPALGPIDWEGVGTQYFLKQFVHLIISGGESGALARPSHPDWHRRTRNFCQAKGIPYFFKGWGAWVPAWGEANHILYGDGRLVEADHEHPDAWKQGLAEPMVQTSKKQAGRLLDGVEWNQLPGRETTKNNTKQPRSSTYRWPGK